MSTEAGAIPAEASGAEITGDLRFLESIRATTSAVLARVLADQQDVALLDVPNQRNVGDSLIWAGETEYLRGLGKRIGYSADLHTYTPHGLRRHLARRPGPILLHGGGNFGDLWEGHQAHRERIVQQFPDRRIVQLPQSVYFRSAERARVANDILGRHPDFLLLLRDHESMDRAAAQLPDVRSEFCPDMALGWSGAPRRPVDVPHGRHLVILARADIESSTGLAEVGPDWVRGARTLLTDWVSSPEDEPAWDRARASMRRAARWSVADRLVPLSTSKRWQNRFADSIGAISNVNIAGGVRLFAPADLIVVDRLHAHVLAGLMGIDHILLDNNYGKLGAVFNDYSHQFSTARKVASVDEARQLAQSLLGTV